MKLSAFVIKYNHMGQSYRREPDGSGGSRYMFAAQLLRYAWWDSIVKFWDQIWKAILEVRVFDIIDIIIVAFLLYKLIGLVRETRASQLVKGLILLIVGALLAKWLHLRVLDYILTNVLSYGVLAMIVVFQPELRRVLEQVGRSKVSRLNIFAGGQLDEHADEQHKREMIDRICTGVVTMSLQKVGALICIERETKLGDVIQTGTVINADVTSELIGSVFFPNSPMHDGAMVIRDGRIYAAGCFLPLSNTNEINKQLGTRHRAALGMSENSDALVIVVSEETGVISTAESGKLTRELDIISLRKKLESVFLPTKQNEQNERRSVFRRVKQNGKNRR